MSLVESLRGVPRRVPGVYAIAGPGGKTYVGSAVNLHRRCRSHASALRRTAHGNCYLQRAYSLHGPDAFEFKVLDTCTPGELAPLEELWCRRCSSHSPDFGYNLSPVGRVGDVAESTRERLSRALLGKPKTAEHRSRVAEARRGKSHGPLSEAHKAKLSSIMRERVASGAFASNLAKLISTNTGRPRPASTKEKISLANRNRRLSEQTKAKIREAHLGRKHGPLPLDVIEKIRKANTGKRRSVECRRRLSEAKRGRPLGPPSAEHRRKLSEARLLWWARKRVAMVQTEGAYAVET